MTTSSSQAGPSLVLRWMQAHPDRLRALLGEEASGADDVTPASEAAIRAHLRFVTEALAAGADESGRERLESLAGSLDGDAVAGRLGAAIELVGGAIAHELRLQFGESPTADPTLGDMTGRRVRLAAWHRVQQREIDRGGPDAVAGTEVANRIGQAATSTRTPASWSTPSSAG